jgi:hypothetical protein
MTAMRLDTWQLFFLSPLAMSLTSVIACGGETPDIANPAAAGGVAHGGAAEATETPAALGGMPPAPTMNGGMGGASSGGESSLGGATVDSPIDPTAQPADPSAGFAPTGLSDPELVYAPYTQAPTDRVISRARYYDGLRGFWLGQNVANWSGLITEMDKDGTPGTLPFYTDADWGGADQLSIWGFPGPAPTIGFYFTQAGTPWGSDDDTDIEYMYQHLLDTSNTSILSAEQLRAGWLEHISPDEENYLWVSNQSAYDLMLDEGLVPPNTSEPENNPNFAMIDAQLTTEIFGLFAPARPDKALQMAHLPIRTTAKDEAEWASEFYVIAHSLASYVNPALPMKDRLFWLAGAARTRLPAGSYVASMYDFIWDAYQQNPDKSDWESTRDAVYEKYQRTANGISDGYVYQYPYDSGINFAAGLISLFYGEGDLPRTVQIGALAGWDSDNPTATWGGLIGFLLGSAGVEEAFEQQNLSETYWILRTRRNFPDHTPDIEGEDSFSLMAERALYIIDRVVLEELGGGVDLERDVWLVPDTGGSF